MLLIWFPNTMIDWFLYNNIWLEFNEKLNYNVIILFYFIIIITNMLVHNNYNFYPIFLHR
jgi:hypothetical protein